MLRYIQPYIDISYTFSLFLFFHSSNGRSINMAVSVISMYLLEMFRCIEKRFVS